ncbi:ATP-grasp domain-containing protein [Porphyromonas gulae]|uniref:ATP-grasp domain-containing protein n=1 Tax=Porphyromonas gulae TaxID=111105 RepID=UPI0026F11826|nr:ATP-grasp domain-containing protein [Porphyromonas gulae]
MNILFTCIGRRNYLLHYFRESFCGDDNIIATDMSYTAPGMAEADIPIIVPSVYDQAYVPTLIEIVKSYNIQAIISLNDLELPILSANKNNFEKLGCKLLVSDDRVIDLTFDKNKTACFLKSIGLETPLTFTKKEFFMEAYKHGNISFPIVIKPRWGSASIGIEFPQEEKEFELVDALSRIKLHRTILSTASANALDEAILYQEMIQGEEYGMDILNDFEGNYVGTFARKKLSMRAGETDKAETVISELLEHIGRTISKNLRHIGNLDCDVLVKDGKYYVLELNARFGGGYPFSHEGGAKGTSCYMAWLRGEKDISKYLQYQNGLIFSKCDRLIEIKKTHE